MNIAIIKRKYQTEGGGGAENYARYIINGLLKKGHKIFIIAKDFKAEETDLLKHIPVKVNKIISSSGTTAFHKGVQKILKKAVIDNKINVTYALSRTYPVDIFRVTEQVHVEWMNLNYSQIHKLNPRHKGILNLEKKIFSFGNSKAVVTNSELSKQLIIKHYKYPEKNIHVLRNGISSDFYEAKKSEAEKAEIKMQLLGNNFKDKFILLFAATNFHIKGLDFAIKALADLPENIKEKAVLLVLGGDNPDKYKKLAENLNVSSKLLFLGSCRNMKSYYLISDLLLYPSLGEPFGNVCLEAAATGLPIITTLQNGSYEVVIEGKNGYLLSSASDVKKMSDSITEYYNLSKTEKLAYTQNSIEISRKYSWAEHLENLEKLLKQKGNII